MYLATVFTSQFLSKQGIDVDLVYRKPNQKLDVAPDLDFGEMSKLHSVGGGHDGWRDKFSYLSFVVQLVFIAWRKRPDAIIGYNKLGLLASYIVTRFSPKTRLIYHNYDFDISRMQDILGRCELSAARKADLTIFPAPGRSAEYKAIAALQREPVSVLNCYPLSFVAERTGELQQILDKRGMNFDRLVVRLGMVGPHHSIKMTIRSIPFWRGNWGFIMAGFASKEYLKELDALTEELGITDRVLILSSVSNSLWYDILHSGDLGVALYDVDPSNIGHSFMAGTSQKLNGYFVRGIPSLVPSTPDFKSFVDRHKTSKLVDVLDPTSIANAVNSFLEDAQEYEKYKKDVKRAFKSEFNFEKQFEPVFKWLNNIKEE